MRGRMRVFGPEMCGREHTDAFSRRAGRGDARASDPSLEVRGRYALSIWFCAYFDGLDPIYVDRELQVIDEYADAVAVPGDVRLPGRIA